MIRIRRIVQILFLLLFVFLFLQTEQKGKDELGLPAKLFLDFDPLLALGSLLASHKVMATFAFSLVTLAVTALLGRVFCGWVCPLGTLNNWVGTFKRRSKKSLGWFQVKYYLLGALLLAALFGLNLTGVFDPLSLLVRSLALSIFPVFNLGIEALVDGAYALGWKPLQTAADGFHTVLLRSSIHAFQLPRFHQALGVGLIFIGILALNLLERRFWCRYLCPLGALLGLVGRWSLLKRNVSEGCTTCRACEHPCEAGGADGKDWRPTECIYCLSCDDGCPKRIVSFGFKPRPAPMHLDLSRRKWLLAGASGAVGTALFRVAPGPRSTPPNPGLIRPPGAAPEAEFLQRCVKCGECMKVCTTNGLQPTLMEAGLEGIWTPRLVPRIGHCEYGCTLCGQVCPTGAIRRLRPEEKTKVKIGQAMFDRSRCLPWAHGTDCIVCEEHCPTPTKAIWFETVTRKNREGQDVPLKRPHVDLELCIGCGICEAKCPVVDIPGVVVTSIGESRSKQNQLLLSTGGYGG